jgi:uncharacterized membrane protein
MTASKPGIGNRIAPASFMLFLALLAAGCAVAARWLDWQHAVLAGFSVAAAAFLAAVTPLLASDPAEMRGRAARNDANRVLLLVLTVVIALVVLVTIASVLAERGAPSSWAIALIIVTLLLAWLFANTVFALHYAHLYYLPRGQGDLGGLDFPATQEPDYPDFLYFSFTLGMTFQTSDVAIPGRHMRRVVLFHTLAAFVFNIGILAFTINALGGS